LKGDIDTDSGKGAGDEEVVEEDGKVERHFSVRNIAAVKKGRDLVSDLILYEKIRFNLD